MSKTMYLGISSELYQLSHKLGMLDMGFVFKRHYSYMRGYELRGFTVWLDMSDNGNHSVGAHQKGVITHHSETFKSKRKLLRLLVKMGCAEAIALVRQQKIDKLLVPS